MQRNLFTYIWRHSKPEQVVILGLVFLAQIFYFMSLTVPKDIVNNGISGNAFKNHKTIPFLVWELDLSAFLPGKIIRIFDGFQVDQLGYLVTMSFVFLGAVIVNSQFKKSINTQKGRMGERMLRRLRYELYDRILRFPAAHFRKVKQAELATMIKDEVEPLGGFIGDAYVQPMFLGGQALTAIFFIVLQNWLLGFIVVALLGVQMVIIPRLRKPVLILGRERQLTARQLAGRIAETADGVAEIHIHGASNYERADITERLGKIYKIRFDLYQKKFVAKFWNNILSQATPFAIYLVGGYFAYTGDMNVGAVVGVLLAYKDLPSPIKELIDWDQQRQDVQIKYEQVIDQFQPEGMMPEELQALPDGPPPPLGKELALAGVTVSEDGRVKQLDSVSLTLPTCTRTAVIGGSNSGKDVLGQLLARMILPSSGSIKLDGADFFRVPEYVLGSRTSYVGQDTYLFPLSVRDNLLFGLKNRPVTPATYDDAARAPVRDERREVRRRVHVQRREGGGVRDDGQVGHVVRPRGLVDEVEAQRVHLERRHEVHRLLDDAHGHEVPARVDHEAAHGEARRVDDRHRAELIVRRVDGACIVRRPRVPRQLRERLKAAQRAPHCGRVQRRAGSCHCQAVRLINAEAQRIVG